MPRRNPWAPIAQDFWEDPEIRELWATYGIEAVIAWQKILFRSDRQDGVIKCSKEQLAHGLVVSVTNPRHRVVRASSMARRLVDAQSWMVQRGWLIESPNGLVVANYWKYHADKADKRRQRGGHKTDTSALPSETFLKEKEKRALSAPGGGKRASNSTPSSTGFRATGELEKMKEWDRELEQERALSSPVDSTPMAPIKTPEDRQSHADRVRRQADAILGSNGAKPPGGDLVDPPGLEEPDPLDPFSSLRSLDPEQFEVAAAELRQRAREYGLDPAIIEAGIDKAREGKA